MAKYAVVYRQMTGFEPVINGYVTLPPIEKEIIADIDAYFQNAMEMMSVRFSYNFPTKKIRWYYEVREDKVVSLKTLKKIFR